MKWSLFLFILMGRWSFFTCRLYEYHFIEENQTWDEAKEFCRKQYTDLATVFDMTDMKRLHGSTENQDAAWIGLYNEPGEKNRTWHWSLPGVEFNESETVWDYNDEDGNCVLINVTKWKGDNCTHMHQFICYNGRQQSNKTFYLINSTMKWPNAQNYCREHHTDLVSGLSQLEEDKFKNETNKFPNEAFWIGLFRDTWRWSDGNHSSFRNWDLESIDKAGTKNTKKCAMTVSNGLTWDSADCNETKPFFCYDDKVILIKENKTWTEALDYCRHNHHDLVSITNRHQQRWVQERAKSADTDYVWLGLRYTCTLDFWFWVNDNIVCYEKWGSANKTADSCGYATAMGKNDHKWHKTVQNEQFNFICTL